MSSILKYENSGFRLVKPNDYDVVMVRCSMTDAGIMEWLRKELQLGDEVDNWVEEGYPVEILWADAEDTRILDDENRNSVLLSELFWDLYFKLDRPEIQIICSSEY